jgi:hypothetical protein
MIIRGCCFFILALSIERAAGKGPRLIAVHKKRVEFWISTVIFSGTES